MSENHDFYNVLGVDRQADLETIKKAYRRLARQFHPDVNKEADAESRFKEISAAYEILSDPQKRAAYDRFGMAGVRPGAGPGDLSDYGPFADIFDEFFGAGRRGRGARQGPQKGADLRVGLDISFEEAVFGTKKEIEIPRNETCPVCKGSGAEPGTTPIRCPQCKGAGEVRRVQQSIFGQFVNVTACPRCEGAGEVLSTPCRECQGSKAIQHSRRIMVEIPAGVDDGTQIRLSNEGDAGLRNGAAGSLYVVLNVQPHAIFQRRENDIILEYPINVAQAALGDEVEVPILDGNSRLTIPAGTQNGDVFYIRGKGVPFLRRSGRGDQIVIVTVPVPRHLTTEQRELFDKLGKTLGREPIGHGEKSLFDKLKDAFKV
ncbi:MAG: molecular chaperone DnaJ [Chloroflexi bacterium]|nr:molecular chaperone DnaJ [Chloroflexota bacterium]